jgi:uncharacterized membrane protein
MRLWREMRKLFEHVVGIFLLVVLMTGAAVGLEFAMLDGIVVIAVALIFAAKYILSLLQERL